MGPSRRRVVLRLLRVSCVVVAAACRHDTAVPERLVDGSPAAASAVELATIRDSTIVGVVEVDAVDEVADGSAAASCLDELEAEHEPWSGRHSRRRRRRERHLPRGFQTRASRV